MARTSSKAAAAKAAAVKETAAAPEKAPAKKAAPKAEKATDSKVNVNVFIEYKGGQIVAKNIVSDVMAAYTAANPGKTAENVEVYIKPEERAAYYVVNGEANGEKIELFF